MKRTIGVCTVALAGGALGFPAASSADTYAVFSCRAPQGGPVGTAGWAGSNSGTGVANDTCSAGGALNAVLPDANPEGNASAQWKFTAPPSTRIVSFAALRITKGLSKSNQPRDVSYTLFPDTATALEDCAPSGTSSCAGELTTPLAKQGLAANTMTFAAQCLNAGGTCSRPLAVSFSQMVLGLQDSAPPVVTNARLLDSGDRSGRLTVGYNVADAGGGVYRGLIKVDGKSAGTVPLGTGACTDANPGDSDPYQFVTPVPCPAAVSEARTTVDVKSLPDGPHAIEIAVEDAAGNQTNVYGPVEFPRLNTGSGSSKNVADVVRGRLRMWFVKAGNRGRSYTSRFGRRVVTRGLLQDRRGRGIQGARIDVYHIRRGKKRLLKTGLKSRARGRLTLILPLNVDTRRVQYVFRALRPGPATSTQSLRLKVRRNGRTYYRGSRRGN